MYPFTITTLGCKVNQYDTQTISELLVKAGLSPAKQHENPHLIVVNTCCITTTAMRKTRQAIRRSVRNSSNPAVWILGCYADYDKQKIQNLLADLGISREKSLIVGHHDDIFAAAEKFIAEIFCNTPPVSNNTHNEEIYCESASPAIPQTIKKRRLQALSSKPNVSEIPSISRFAGHQRAFVKVQDGCDAFCAYCIVPFTRGRVWSKSIEHVVAECASLIAAGHREIVLCGVFLGAFGRTPKTTIRKNWNDDKKPAKLAELVRRVAGLDGLWQVRLSSLEPGDLTDELLDVAATCPNVAPHFHLPLQSGSNRILQKMNRQYSTDEFAETAAKVRQLLDKPAITTDIIVGFPEETDKDFAETLKMAKLVKFSKIHAFPFSPIEPTAAWSRRQLSPPQDVMKQRLTALSAVEQLSAVAYRELFVGETLEALVEAEAAKDSQKILRGMTSRYLTVEFPVPGENGGCNKPSDHIGRVVKVHIDSTTDNGLAGHM